MFVAYIRLQSKNCVQEEWIIYLSFEVFIKMFIIILSIRLNCHRLLLLPFVLIRLIKAYTDKNLSFLDFKKLYVNEFYILFYILFPSFRSTS